MLLTWFGAAAARSSAEFVPDGCLCADRVVPTKTLLRVGPFDVCALENTRQLRFISSGASRIPSGQLQPAGGRHSGHYDTVAGVCRDLFVIGSGAASTHQFRTSTPQAFQVPRAVQVPRARSGRHFLIGLNSCHMTTLGLRSVSRHPHSRVSSALTDTQ